MSDEHVTCATLGELADYWTEELSPEDEARVEAHVFDCAACARRLADARALARGIADLVRSGRFQAVVDDAILNRLARDGVRVRTYALDPDAIVPCAVWSDDDIVAVRLRADLTGFESVSIQAHLGTGEVTDRVSDVPVRAEAREIIQAWSAAGLRQLPQMRLQLTIVGEKGGGPEETIARYVLEHAGAVSRERP